MRIRSFFVFGVLLATMVATVASAQGDAECLATLSHAESEFAAGRFFGIPALLKECLDRDKYSNEEKVRVYMLLAQVYLLTDNPTEADRAYLQLLRSNPEFLPSDSDPVDIIYLSKKFTTRPVFTPHIKLGGNLSSQSVIYPQNTISTPDSTRARYTPMAGWTMGGGVEWNITDNVGIGGEVLLSRKSFRRQIDNIFRNDQQMLTERQTWFDIPLYLRYGISTGRIRPYVYAGGSINLLVGAKVEEVQDDVTPPFGSEPGKVVSNSDVPRSIMYKRKYLNRSLVFGTGAKVKLGKDFLLFDLRYMPGLSNVVNLKTNNYASKSRDVLDQSAAQFGSVPDIFRVNNFSITVGYVRPLYNARSVTKVRTKSVSKRLNKEANER